MASGCVRAHMLRNKDVLCATIDPLQVTRRQRTTNATLVHRALGLALANPVSRDWKGYWQRHAV
jgi:hypothetical protein